MLETLIATSILFVVLGAVYGLLGVGTRGAIESVNAQYAQQQGRASVDVLQDEFRWADAIVAAYSSSVTVRVPEGSPCVRPEFCNPLNSTTLIPYHVTLSYDAAAWRMVRTQDWQVIPPVAAQDGPVSFRVTKASFEFYDGANNQADPTASEAWVLEGHRRVPDRWDDLKGPYATRAQCEADMTLDPTTALMYSEIRCAARVGSGVVRVMLRATTVVGGRTREIIATVVPRGR